MDSYKVTCPYCGMQLEVFSEFLEGTTFLVQRGDRVIDNQTFKTGCKKPFVIKLQIVKTIEALKIEGI